MCSLGSHVPQTAGFMLGGGDARSSELLSFAWTRAVHVSSVLCCSLLTTLLVRTVTTTAAIAAHMTMLKRGVSCFASIGRRGGDTLLGALDVSNSLVTRS